VSEYLSTAAGWRPGQMTVLVGDSGPKTVFDRTTPAEPVPVTAKTEPLLTMLEEAENPETAAQGFVQRVGDRVYPYRVDRPDINGDHVHFWLGDTTPFEGLVLDLARVAFQHSEAIRFTYSGGSPAYFESHKMLRAK
jgi:hypothetical protein